MMVVTNIVTPRLMHLQLARNVNNLNIHMCELTRLYEGVASSLFDMPLENQQCDSTCAVIYPGDENWTRARIVSIYKSELLVQAVDYGYSFMVRLLIDFFVFVSFLFETYFS
jgi:hypothetical protein